MTVDVQDKSGEIVTIPELDENGDCIPRDNNEKNKYSFGKPLGPNWQTDFTAVPVTETGEIPGLLNYRLYGAKANPNGKNTLIDFGLTFKTSTLNVYNSKQGALLIDGKSTPITETPETAVIKEFLEELKTEEAVADNYTPLQLIRNFIAENSNSSKNNYYTKITGITTGFVTEINLEKGYIRISEEDMPDHLDSRGVTVWIPDNMTPDIVLEDEIFLTFSGTIKDVRYDGRLRKQVSATVEDGDITLSAMGIFPIWTDREEEPDDIPKDIVKKEFTISEI